jgi:hypothetical protein
VDVRIEVGRDKRVRAHLTVEQPATLTDLMRAQKEIERALNEAGLLLNEDGLQFSLESGAEADRRETGGQRQSHTAGEFSDQAAAAPPPRAQPLSISRFSSGRVDLFA